MPESCYTLSELRDFALGRIDDERSDDILLHLNQCSACEDTITSLENTADSLLNHLRLKPAASPVAEVPGPAAEAIERIKSADNFVAKAPDTSSIESAISTNASPQQVGEYRIIKLLGAGGMGAVYQAVHTRLDRMVAIKILHPHRLGFQNSIERFEREIKAVGRLDHPAIVAATDAGESNGSHFLVMEYVDGVNLSRLLKTVGPLSVADACEIIRQAAVGIQYVHDQQLVHRDIKPSNIMLTSEGRVKILDLGLALNGDEHGFNDLTTIGQVMGTLDYMAPEQCDDSHNVTAPADVYSLGATLFKLLTGSAPFENEGQLLGKLRAIALRDAPRVDSLCANLPNGLAALTASALEKSSSERIATAKELATGIEEFCDGSELPELFKQNQSSFAQMDQSLGKVAHGKGRESFSDGVDTDCGVGDVRKRLPTLFEQPATPQPATTPPRHNRFGTSILSCLFAAIVIVASGITIWIKTDNGTLIVKSEAKATLNLIKDGVTKKFEIKPGENKTQIRSGEYEVVLDQAFESMRVDKETVSLTRGGSDFASITFKSQQKPTTPVEDNKTPATIPKGMRVVSLKVEPTTSHIETLVPGHRVDVMCTFQKRSRDGMVSETRTALQFVEIFSVSRSEQQGGSGSTNVALLVTRKESESFLRAKDIPNGNLHLALRSNEDTERTDSSELNYDWLDQTGIVWKSGHDSTTDSQDIKPVYQGKTYSEWMAQFRAETEKGELSKMVTALITLSSEKQLGETVEAVFEVQRKRASKSVDVSEAMIPNAQFPIGKLQTVAVVDVILKKLSGGSSAERWLATSALIAGYDENNQKCLSNLGQTAYTQSPEKLQKAMLVAASDERIGGHTVRLAIDVFEQLPVDWLPILKKLPNSGTRIALQIVRLEPSNEQGADKLFAAIDQRRGVASSFLRPQDFAVFRRVDAPLLDKHFEKLMVFAFGDLHDYVTPAKTRAAPFEVKDQNDPIDIPHKSISSIRIEAMRLLARIGPKAGQSFPQFKQLIETVPTGNQNAAGSAEKFEHANAIAVALHAIETISESPDSTRQTVRERASRLSRLKNELTPLRVAAQHFSGKDGNFWDWDFESTTTKSMTTAKQSLDRWQEKLQQAMNLRITTNKELRTNEYTVAILRRQLESARLSNQLANIKLARPGLNTEAEKLFHEQNFPATATQVEGENWGQWRARLFEHEEASLTDRTKAVKALCAIAVNDSDTIKAIVSETLAAVMLANDTFDHEVPFCGNGWTPFHQESATALAPLVSRNSDAFIAELQTPGQLRRRRLAMAAFQLAKVGGKFRRPFEQTLQQIVKEDSVLLNEAIATALAAYGHLSPSWKPKLEAMFKDKSSNKDEVAEQLVRIDRKHTAAISTLIEALKSPSKEPRFFESELSDDEFRYRMMNALRNAETNADAELTKTIVFSTSADDRKLIRNAGPGPQPEDDNYVSSTRVAAAHRFGLQLKRQIKKESLTIESSEHKELIELIDRPAPKNESEDELLERKAFLAKVVPLLRSFPQQKGGGPTGGYINSAQRSVYALQQFLDQEPDENPNTKRSAKWWEPSVSYLLHGSVNADIDLETDRAKANEVLKVLRNRIASMKLGLRYATQDRWKRQVTEMRQKLERTGFPEDPPSILSSELRALSRYELYDCWDAEFTQFVLELAEKLIETQNSSDNPSNSSKPGLIILYRSDLWRMRGPDTFAVVLKSLSAPSTNRQLATLGLLQAQVKDRSWSRGSGDGRLKTLIKDSRNLPVELAKLANIHALWKPAFDVAQRLSTPVSRSWLPRLESEFTNGNRDKAIMKELMRLNPEFIPNVLAELSSNDAKWEAAFELSTSLSVTFPAKWLPRLEKQFIAGNRDDVIVKELLRLNPHFIPKALAELSTKDAEWEKAFAMATQLSVTLPAKWLPRLEKELVIGSGPDSIIEHVLRLNPKHKAASVDLFARIEGTASRKSQVKLSSVVRLLPNAVKEAYLDRIITNAFSKDAATPVRLSVPYSTETTSVQVELLRALESMKAAALPAKTELLKVIAPPKPRIFKEDTPKEKLAKEEALKARELAEQCLRHFESIPRG